MSDYPKIYSISTVGVRNHNNANFLFHHLRTDFTGNNGLGKSVIADLLQLIFVPMRDEWKPGTDGMGDRKIETIPLERPWIEHAYAFLNIEKSEGQFIVMGVLIPNKSRLPVRPFIIQKSPDFQRRSPLRGFSQPLDFNDFIKSDNRIMDLQEAGRYLEKKYGIYIKNFYQKEAIKDYYDLLYKNQIIPIDLTKESNLRSYAKVLQSFSRAKTLDIKKSKSLQNFLFEDNEDIRLEFDRQKSKLTEAIREYKNTNNEIRALEEKQKYLTELKEKYDKFSSVNTEYLVQKALYTSARFLLARDAFDKNQKQLNTAYDQYTHAEKELKTYQVDYYVKLLEQRGICSEIRTQLQQQQFDATDENIKILKEKLEQKRAFIRRITTLAPLIDEFKNQENISDQYELQTQGTDKLRQLRRLQNIPAYSAFEASEWAVDFEVAEADYNVRIQSIQKEISNLEELQNLYEGNNPDSLFNWALKKKTPLSLAQETVLMNFKDIFIKKTAALRGAKFTLKPDQLLQSFEEENEGVWLILGDLKTFVPYVKKQIFNDGKKLTQAIKRGKTEIEEQLNKLRKEFRDMRELFRSLQDIGLNRELTEIYKNRKNIEEFTQNNLLRQDNVAFIQKHFDAFGQLDKLEDEAEGLDQRIDDLVGQRRSFREEERQNEEAISSALLAISRLKHKLEEPDISASQNWKNNPTEQLKNQRSENLGELKELEQQVIHYDRLYERQKQNYDIANQLNPNLKKTKEDTEILFKKAKYELHRETEQQFDNLMKTSELDEVQIKELEDKARTLGENYRNAFSRIAEKYEETKQEKRHPELYPSGKCNHNFQTLLNILCGKVGLEGLTQKLEQLNNVRKSFGDLQISILGQVFGQVEKQYRDCDLTVTRLNNFFKSRKVSNNYRFKIEFTPRQDINIDWIQKMKSRAEIHQYGASLFTPIEDLPDEENTPDNLIQNIARQFYSAVNCTPDDLLNPKFYFNLSIKMEDDEGKTNSGSGGQSYTALALLCIGRLSIVQRGDKDRKGVRFIIIEELSNIDDTNFSIFPKIAKKFNYQLLTMTPKPFGSYSDDEWFLHMLVRGKEEKDLNYKAMSFFKNKYKGTDLEQHIKAKNKISKSKKANSKKIELSD